MSQEQIVQLTVEEASKNMERMAALERLMANPDFKNVIFDGYFKEEPARLASLVGDIAGSYRWAPAAGQTSLPQKEFVQMQNNIERDIHAVGALQSYFRVVAYRAESSRQALEDIEAAKNDPSLASDETEDKGFAE